MTLELVWKNPKSYWTNKFPLKNSEVLVTGWYNTGESDNNGKILTKPSFEIEAILMVITNPKGQIVHIPVSKMLEDLNSITWRKDTDNDLFEYFEHKMIEYCGKQIKER